MESIRRQRRAHKQLAAEAMGLNGRYDRIWAAQVGGLLQDTRMAQLPPNPNPVAVQDAAGNDTFVMGLHQFV